MREETRTGERRTALVTGASAGIGAALARVFAEHGFDAVLVARRREHLEELAAELESACGVRARALPADLSDPAAPRRISDTLREEGVDVDVLVNNAGYALREGFCESSWEDHAAFLQVMGISVAELCHRFLPGMKERGYGRIVNVSSLAVFAPEVAGSLYRAVKAFVVSLSEALAMELEGTGIHVTALCPGFTVTEFHDVAGTRNQVRARRVERKEFGLDALLLENLLKISCDFGFVTGRITGIRPQQYRKIFHRFRGNGLPIYGITVLRIACERHH